MINNKYQCRIYDNSKNVMEKEHQDPMNDTNIEHQAVNSLIQIKREQKTRTGNERVGFVIVYDFIFILHSN